MCESPCRCGCYCYAICSDDCCACCHRNLDLLNLGADSEPEVVFLVNRRSGGLKGGDILDWAKEKRHAYYDLLDCTKDANVLAQLRATLVESEKRLLIVVAGGDGTLSWALTTVDKALLGEGYDPLNPDVQNRLHDFYLKKAVVRFIPLGTGNDICRCLGCGNSFPGMGSVPGIIETAFEGTAMSYLDVWYVEHRDKSDELTPWQSNFMCAYISIGSSANNTREFHKQREENPKAFNSQTKNKINWMLIGAGKTFSRERPVNESCSVSIGNTPVEFPSKARDVLFLNVNSIGSGTNIFNCSGYVNNEQWQTPSFGDGLLEMYTGNGTSSLGMASSFGIRLYSRINQSDGYSIEIKQKCNVQFDGEGLEVEPGRINIKHHKAIRVLLGSCRPRNPVEVDTNVRTKYILEQSSS